MPARGLLAPLALALVVASGCTPASAPADSSPPLLDAGRDAGHDTSTMDGPTSSCEPSFPGAFYGPCSDIRESRCVDGEYYGCDGRCWLATAGPCPGPPDDTGVDADLDAAPLDAGTDAPATPDAGTDAPATPDAGVPATMTYCVDIDVSNTCEMSVSPTSITIPPDQTAYFCWRNRSADYPVDVWLSYGGGYTDLPPGSTWNEPPGHCLGPTAHDEYADISTACSSFRFLIHCL